DYAPELDRVLDVRDPLHVDVGMGRQPFLHLLREYSISHQDVMFPVMRRTSSRDLEEVKRTLLVHKPAHEGEDRPPFRQGILPAELLGRRQAASAFAEALRINRRIDQVDALRIHAELFEESGP